MRQIGFTEAQLRTAIAESLSWTEAVRRMGYCPSGGNWRTIKKYAAIWKIDTSHFDPDAVRARALRRTATPLQEVLVRRSTYNRGSLKRRLYDEGLKQRRCELCGQDEIWRGKRISLILDHINGERDDNRLDNLQIVCPNCAATLPTHCGRTLRRPLQPAECERCGKEFEPRYRRQRFCSRDCGQRSPRKRAGRGRPRPETRKVERPHYEQLLREIEETSWLAVGRKYGVSDNAVRKWVRWYELQREREAEDDSTADHQSDP